MIYNKDLDSNKVFYMFLGFFTIAAGVFAGFIHSIS